MNESILIHIHKLTPAVEEALLRLIEAVSEEVAEVDNHESSELEEIWLSKGILAEYAKQLDIPLPQLSAALNSIARAGLAAQGRIPRYTRFLPDLPPECRELDVAGSYFYPTLNAADFVRFMSSTSARVQLVKIQGVGYGEARDVICKRLADALSSDHPS